MLIEDRVFEIFSKDAGLIAMLESMREKNLEESFGEALLPFFKGEIPNFFAKEELSPFIRINPIHEVPGQYADDCKFSEIQTVQIDWWCKNTDQSERIKKLVDKILEEQNFEQYYSDRYDDPDIKLKMNVRKYRYVEFI